MSPALAPLGRRFHHRPVVELAAALLGHLLVRRAGRRLLVGRIVETEAYGGHGCDDSAHSFRGPTPRCAVMFGPAGHAYVYMTQGALFCMNVTAQGDRAGKAVLLRALEPVRGAEAMRAARLARLAPGPTARRLASGHEHELAAGPGRLCLALGIGRELDGVDLTDASSPLYLARGTPVPAERVRWTPRIGLNSGAFSYRWAWRALDRGSDSVSRQREFRRFLRAPRPQVCPAPRS